MRAGGVWQGWDCRDDTAHIVAYQFGPMKYG